MNHTITIKKKYTNQQIDDLLSSAFEGGIFYWCTQLDVKDNDFRGKAWPHEVITQGGTIILVDEDDKKHTLTLKKVLKALSMKPGLDIERHNAGDADEIVQLAIFGEVVYE